MALVKRKTWFFDVAVSESELFFGSTMLWVSFGSLLSSFGVHGWCPCVVA